MSTFKWMVGDNSRWATAHADKTLDHYTLWDLIESGDTVRNWNPIQFRTDNTGKLSDFPPCDIIGRLCSPKLVESLSEFAHSVVWLPVVILHRGLSHEYFFMHFAVCADVLNLDKSTFLDGDLLNPHLSRAKADEYPLICFRKLSPSLIAREDVCDKLAISDLTGFKFDAIPSS